MNRSTNQNPIVDRSALRLAAAASENEVLKEARDRAAVSAAQASRDSVLARRLAEMLRRTGAKRSMAESFLHTYNLSTEEGVILMCLAEALLRIPDARTADQLIEDKLGAGDWSVPMQRTSGFVTTASSWALIMTGRLLSKSEEKRTFAPDQILKAVVARLGEPVARQALRSAMEVLARQFVLGETIARAAQRAQPDDVRGGRFSFDLLGDAARTERDARRYFAAYQGALQTVAQQIKPDQAMEARASVSIKLSALHPRFEFAQSDRVRTELAERAIALAREARTLGVPITIDAEETDRLEPMLDVVERLGLDDELRDWNGLGLALQAYQKRVLACVDWTRDLAERRGARMMARLVKGAYWDTEIKRAQVFGLEDYPVFTRKRNTDLGYLAAAKAMLDAGDAIFSAFATHNAFTIAAVLGYADDRDDFEFQRLHGMGEALYAAADEAGVGVPHRVYAPVGAHKDLLAYLVRRLLENGANTSFVHLIAEETTSIEELIADPRADDVALDGPHPNLIRPRAVFGPERRDFHGVDLAEPHEVEPLLAAMAAVDAPETACSIVQGRLSKTGPTASIVNPATGLAIGEAVLATEAIVETAVEHAAAAFSAWNAQGGEKRAAILEKAADLLERRMADFMALAVREAGKTVPDALAEVREAVDFLRYYALEARRRFTDSTPLAGPTGERNELLLEGRGVFGCISPWNFPLAIFIGQVSAALAAGNSVVAKPAEQTPMIAMAAVKLLHEAGVPGDVLHLVLGDGPTVGAPLTAARRLSGVAFTGSTDTAKAIYRALAMKDGPIPSLIAETGGANAMIVDSSALPEQVARDVLASAFQSAGQRCSALRILFLQQEVADEILEMIAGAAAELRIGDPGRLSTDVGPVIDPEAQALLEAHAADMTAHARLAFQAELGDADPNGYFVAPRIFELKPSDSLPEEKFGPILHVVRYDARRLDAVIDQINATEFGLTLGVHSRVDAVTRHIAARAKVGNVYVNRNQIGAVVGSQPFGGRGLSGTGPKAGGPNYLPRFAAEKAICTDTTAAGGNASLMTMG